MSNPNVGYATLQVIPSFKGAQSALSSGLAQAEGSAGAAGLSAGSSFGTKFAAGLAVAGTVVAAGAAAAVVGAYKIGEAFDDAYDRIRVGTGATGTALAGLEADFKNVIRQVPTDFASASEAITVLNQKLGLTGAPLQSISDQFLEVSRITGTDLASNLKVGTDVLNQFSISGEAQGQVLDLMFRASQKSGIGYTDLLARVGDAGTVLRASGFSIEQTTAFVASLGKAGIDTADVMPGLARALGEAAKGGKDAGQFLGELTDKIKNAPDETSAAAIAYDVLGARAGPKFAQLIREGKLSYDDMLGAITGGQETILGAGKDTQDFAEKWQLFKNRVLVALEPIATRVFGALGTAMDKLPGIIADIRRESAPVVAFFRRNWPAVQEAIATAIDYVTTEVWPRLVEGFNYVKGQVDNLVAFFAQRWDKIKEAVRNVVAYLKIVWAPALLLIRSAWDHIGQIVQAAWDYIRGVVQAGVDAIRGIIDIVLGLLTLDFDQVWSGIKSLVAGAWEGIKATIGLALDSIQIGMSIAWDVIKGLAGAAWDVIKEAIAAAWEGIKSIVGDALANLRDAIFGIPGMYLDVVGRVFDAAKSVGGAMVDGIVEGAKKLVDGVGDLATAMVDAVKRVINEQIIDRLNSALEFTIKVPIGPDVHVDAPDIPRLHSGGIYYSGRGEGYALLRDGEGVFTDEQMAHLAPVGRGGGGVNFHGPVTFGDRGVVSDLDYWALTRAAGV